jgi:hypothetical protein
VITATVLALSDSMTNDLTLILTTLLTIGGTIAVAVITSRQNRQGKKIEEVHTSLQTSNGKSVGSYVEEIASYNQEDQAKDTV